MSVISDIIDRLAASGTPFALVEGAGDLAEVDQAPRATPAAYVLAARDTSQPSPLSTGAVRQRIETDIAIVIVTRNRTDRLGGTAAGDIETLKVFVRGRLIGWLPDSAEEPIEHVNGEIVETRSGYVWFEDVFSTAGYIEGEVQ